MIGANESILLLNVPYRTQFDGSLWQSANCGPASLGAVLEAYGIGVSTQVLRDRANQIQGTSGYRDGTAIETLRRIARHYGLQTSGPDDTGRARWTTADIRRQIARGWPVITLVKYRSLPWNSSSSSASLHYIVVVGTTSRGFFVHDVGAAGGGIGRWRVLSASDLERAWADSGYIGLGTAFGPPPGQLALPTAWLYGSEFLGQAPRVVFGGNQSAPVGPVEPAVVDAPLPPAFNAEMAGVEVAPVVPPSFAPLPPSFDSRMAAPSASSFSSAEPLGQVARAVASQALSRAPTANLSRLASSLSDRWAHPLGVALTERMYVEPPAPASVAAATTGPDPALVLAASDVPRTDHSISLVLIFSGLGVALLLLRRTDEV